MKRLDVRSFVFPATLVAIFLTVFQVSSKAQDVVWLPQDAVWSYYQDGEAMVDFDFYEWYEPEYSDAGGWATGAAELGFDTAANSETTLLTRGKITYYFRTTFMVTQSQIDLANQMQLNLVRDDGAVIYINGVEVHRDNMPGNPGSPVSYTTLAEKAVAGADEGRVFPSTHLSNNFLVPGVNTIAVEVHQSSAGSSDISFSLGVDGYNFIPILGDWTPPAPITFENSSANANWYSYILKENDPFELGWWLTSTGGDNTAIHFVHPNLQEPEDLFTEGLSLVTSRGSATLVTDVSETNHRDSDYPGAYRVNLSNYTDVNVQFGLRAYDNTGGGMGSSSKAQVWLETSTTGDTFTSEKVLDIAGGASSGLVDTLVADSATRKVLIPTSDIGTAWRGLGFNDSTWKSGLKGAGYDRATTYNPYFSTGTNSLDLQSQLDGVNGTLYMRVPFNVVDKSAYTALLLCMRYDDGFAAYLNGQLVESRNSPGSLAYNSEASSTNADTRAVVWESFNISDHLDLLNDGANVLAIHGLNSPKTSSDMLIAPELKAIKPGGGGNGGEPETLDDIAGGLDGPFTIFSYDIPDAAQTLRMKFQLNCNTGENAVILDNILVTGTPQTVQTYADWIALTTDFDPDDEGHPTANPDGDPITNLLEYAFGGSATVPDSDLNPTSSIIEIDGVDYFALTWRQRNLSYSGGLGQGEGGFQVGDINYIPEFSTDGINWEGNGGQGGDEVAFLVSGLEEDSEGEYIEVTAAFEDSISLSPPTRRLFGRLRIRLEEQ